jgi:SAM-dependent methyltransferase
MSKTHAFDKSYWTERSQYKKFGDYRAGLDATMRWYEGFFRLVHGDLPSVGPAVDAGCGHGAMVHHLRRRGYDVRGVDASEWVIEQARTHAPELFGAFEVGDVADLPAGGYSLITCSEVLEHVPDPLGVLSHFRDRLAPRGRLIATTPNLRPLIPWWDPLVSDPTHINVHEPHWWGQAAEAAGLRVLRLGTFLAIPYAWRFSAAFSRWLPLGRRTGPGVLLVAERPA